MQENALWIPGINRNFAALNAPTFIDNQCGNDGVLVFLRRRGRSLVAKLRRTCGGHRVARTHVYLLLAAFAVFQRGIREFLKSSERARNPINAD